MNSNTIEIKRAKLEDFDNGIWEIFQEIADKGETYVFDPKISQEEAKSYWMSEKNMVYIACEADEILGTYIIKANQPGLGSHVANASYMVKSTARGKGIGKKMGLHSLDEAKDAGFKAMQFNIVISTNEAAVKLWESLGFNIVGTVPEGYKHKDLGYVDFHIMHRKL